MKKLAIALWLVSSVVGVSAAAAGEVPYLHPGATAVMTGTHVRCAIALKSVACTKAGGLTATVATSGTVRVTKAKRTKVSPAKPVKLHVNGGFANLGANNSNVYCHVYRAAVLTLSCSVNGGSGSSSYKPGSHCFDISDRAVVVCRYDAAGNRHDVKTLPQP